MKERKVYGLPEIPVTGHLLITLSTKIADRQFIREQKELQRQRRKLYFSH